MDNEAITEAFDTLRQRPGAHRHSRHWSGTLRQRQRQQRIWTGHDNSPVPMGRFDKMHAGECGNPRCWLCGNPRRVAKGRCRLTVQELRQPDINSEIDNAVSKG